MNGSCIIHGFLSSSLHAGRIYPAHAEFTTGNQYHPCRNFNFNMGIHNGTIKGGTPTFHISHAIIGNKALAARK